MKRNMGLNKRDTGYRLCKKTAVIYYVQDCSQRQLLHRCSPPTAVADPGGRGSHAPPGPVKITPKKMATKGGHIDFMFLAPPYPADGSATALESISDIDYHLCFWVIQLFGLEICVNFCEYFTIAQYFQTRTSGDFSYLNDFCLLRKWNTHWTRYLVFITKSKYYMWHIEFNKFSYFTMQLEHR